MGLLFLDDDDDDEEDVDVADRGVVGGVDLNKEGEVDKLLLFMFAVAVEVD